MHTRGLGSNNRFSFFSFGFLPGWRGVVRVGVAFVLALGVLLLQVNALAHGSEHDDQPSIVGRVSDKQGQAVYGAKVEVLDGSGNVLAEVESQMDGTFVAVIDGVVEDGLVVEVSRPHFEAFEYEASEKEIGELSEGRALRLADIALDRRVTAGFWFAAFTFALVLALIAFDRLHNTTAALLGVALIFLASFVLTEVWSSLFIYDFERALSFIDFEVIFLVMGMMIVIGIIEGTGIFQWLTYVAFKASRGRVEVLVVILMLITSVASALLDNVTTMLLMTPITLQIAISMGLNPFSLLLPEVMASNVGGISTLVGTPTNILIGSFANISFNDFIVSLTPGVLLALVALIVYVQLRYRKDYQAASSSISPVLEQKLAKDAQIKDRGTLIRSGIVFLGILALFILGEQLNLGPAVAAIMGATAMLLWVNPDVDRMLRAVDWTTLVFFMTLFMLVGAVREVGLVSILADGIGDLVGGNLVVGMIVLVWMSALLSMVIANIPFTAAMLPVVGFLTKTVPGAESKALFYSLSVGSAMGGNGSLIGASANVVMSGIAERAGYRVTFVHFFKVGFPAMLITVAVGLGWVLIRF